MIKIKHLLAIVTVLVLIGTGCTKNTSPVPDDEQEPTMDDLVIPFGFDFKSTKNVTVEINMPASLDFTNLRGRFDIYTNTPDQNGKLINSASFDQNGHYQGEITVPAYLNQIYVSSMAGDVLVDLPSDQLKSGGVIIDFGDDYGYNPPDTVIPSTKTLPLSFKNTKQAGAGINIIGNGDFSSNNFGTIPYWNASLTVDQKWHFTNYYNFTMQWVNDNGNGMIKTPVAGYSGYYYYGGAAQWVAAEPGDVITLTADIKSDGSNGNKYAYLYLIPRAANGNPLAYYNTYYSNPSSNWKTKSIVASMPSGTTHCTVLLWNNDYNSSGSIYYDNVTVSGPVVDSDNDGVSDEDDDYPNDAARAFNIYYPDANSFGSLAFEDNWPGKGDYDFNDAVIDYRYKQVVNSDNELVDLEALFKFKATGATFLNGFGFEMGMEPSDVASVSGTSLVDNYITTLANGTEAGQAKATIIVTDNIFTQLPNPGGGIGTNTTVGATYVSPATLTINLTTTNPVSRDIAGNPPYNPFIIVNEIRGREVHLSDHAPTSLIDNSYFGTLHDNSNPATGKYYKTANNLPWGIDIPEPFAYPVEKAQIINAHLKFASWAESGGILFTDWYQDLSGYRNAGNIYQIP